MHDAAVVGAGLGGLTAACRLASRGYRVLLLERRAAVGGLCRHVDLDGLEFPIGCNEFGSGLNRILGALGAPVAFRDSRTRFHFPHGAIQVPPDLRSGVRLLGLAPQFWRAWRRNKANPGGMLCETADVSPVFDDWMRTLPYGVGASDVPTEFLTTFFDPDLDYGYDKNVIPEGGPGAITRALAQRFEALGGTLLVQTDVTGIKRDAEGFVLDTKRGPQTARRVITSRPRWDAYPALPQGLMCASFHIAVSDDYGWPAGIHAMGWMPARMGDWVRALEAGRAPENFGFHMFRSLLPSRDGRYAVTGYFYLPSGTEEPTKDAIADHRAVLRRGIEDMLPGMLAQSSPIRVLYPVEYRTEVGCTPQPFRFRLPPGFTKPTQHDRETGLFHVGNSVQPPGEHAGGAALSGWLAADAVAELLGAPGA